MIADGRHQSLRIRLSMKFLLLAAALVASASALVMNDDKIKMLIGKEHLGKNMFLITGLTIAASLDTGRNYSRILSSVAHKLTNKCIYTGLHIYCVTIKN